MAMALGREIGQFQDGGRRFLSIVTESINFDHHLSCGGWLNFEFSYRENIRDGPLKLLTRS